MIVTEKFYSKEPKNLTVGIANIGSEPGKIEQNKKKLLSALDICNRKKANLVIFPEYFISGFFWEPEKECRETIAQSGCLDQMTGWLDMVIQTYLNDSLQYIILNGLLRNKNIDNNYFNTTIVLDRECRYLDPGRYYRKRFLPGIEKRYITPSIEGTLVLDTDWGRFGFLTCYDICFPKLFHELANKKIVDAIIVNAAWRKNGKREYKELNIREDDYFQVQWNIMNQALAAQNQSWVMAANAVGPHAIKGVNYCGSSGIWAPSGINMMQASDSEDELLILHNIDIRNEVKKEKEEFGYTQDFAYSHLYFKS